MTKADRQRQTDKTQRDRQRETDIDKQTEIDKIVFIFEGNR